MVHYYKKLLLILLLCVFVLIGGCTNDFTEQKETTQQKGTTQQTIINTDFLDQYCIIAHASGAISGETYLNSLESFIEHYNSGTRIFEIDFSFSSDDELIGVHYWGDLGSEYSSNNRMSLEEFEQTKIRNLYTGITYKNLLNLISTEYQDVYIVLDTKEANYEKFFNKILSDAEEIDIDLLHHFIPQLYNEKMYLDVDEIYNFDYYIYTLYKTTASNNGVYTFLENHRKIVILTVSTERIKSMNIEYIENINNLDRFVFVHTVNSCECMQEYLDIGVTGIYSDTVTEDSYKEYINSHLT
jgi:glycerophosphoryl diester phosphodiesterase